MRTTERMCEVCKQRPAIGVFTSSLGAWSRAFCEYCLNDPNSENPEGHPACGACGLPNGTGGAMCASCLEYDGYMQERR